MAKDGDGFKVDGELNVGNVIKVLSLGSGNNYEMLLGPDGAHACSCPGYQFAGHCKHVDYVVSLQDGNKPEGKELAPAKEEHFEDIVKGRPNLNGPAAKNASTEHLQHLLAQKIEELKEQKKKEQPVKMLHPGAEFKPEQIPFIPDSDHPLLSKHDLATPEHNAGYQDASMVPAMYKDMIRPKKEPEPDKEADINQVTIEVNTTMSPSVSAGPDGGTKPETKPKTVLAPVPQPQQPEFTLRIPRQNMNRGGHYMPNESRPYRPGDTK